MCLYKINALIILCSFTTVKTFYIFRIIYRYLKIFGYTPRVSMYQYKSIQQEPKHNRFLLTQTAEHVLTMCRLQLCNEHFLYSHKITYYSSIKPGIYLYSYLNTNTVKNKDEKYHISSSLMVQICALNICFRHFFWS